MAAGGRRPRDLLLALQREFTDALLRGSEGDALLIVREAIDASLPEAEIDECVIAPALRVVGDLWADGELSVGEEHLATEIAMRVVALERELFRVARERPHHAVVLAAVQGERHVVGLHMAGSLLDHAGYDVKQLGADVPAHALGAVVDRLAPAVVGLTITMPAGRAHLEAAVATVRERLPHAGIVVGGTGVPEQRFEPPGLRVCRTVVEVTSVVDALVQGAPRN